MKTLFLLISLITSTTGITSKIQENYVTNEKILLCATSSSTTSKSYNEITDCYKVGYESFDVPNAYHSDRDYFTFLKISFPLYPGFQSGKLILTLKTGTIQNLESLYYYSDLDYSNTNYQNDGYLPLSTISSNSFEINISSAINNCISRYQNYFYLRLGRSYSGGYGEFYTTDNNNYGPKIELFYDSQPQTNTNGDSSSYDPITRYNNSSLINYNCFAYAVDVFPQDTPILRLENYGEHEIYSNSRLESSINAVISSCLKYNVFPRKLDSYNSPIFPTERRIAFKLVIKKADNTIYSYHFLKQHSDGYWSDKYPESETTLWNTTNPDTITSDSHINSNIYSYSQAVYFAI